MNLPSLSVILPVHNGVALLPIALASIRAQTWTPAEIIVIDDGSTDASAAVAAAAGVTVHRQVRQGVAAARNAGIQRARGDYLAMLDVDDLWPPTALAQLYAGLRATPTAALAHGLTQETHLLTEDLTAPGPALYPPYRFINLGSLLYHRPVFTQVGLFDPGLRSGEDADWLLRAYAAGVQKCPLPVTTLYYRRRAGSLTYQQDHVGLGVLRVAHRWRQRMAQTPHLHWDWAAALAYLGQHPRSARAGS